MRAVRNASPGVFTRLTLALASHEAELRALSERVKLQDELLDAAVNALATIREASREDACKAAARLRDMMFDHRNLSDRASFL
jgi:hypothetical protein